jgi:hypothetical protein
MHGSRSKIPSKKSRPYIYDAKFVALLGAPYIYDISRLRVNLFEVHDWSFFSPFFRVSIVVKQANLREGGTGKQTCDERKKEEIFVNSEQQEREKPCEKPKLRQPAASRKIRSVLSDNQSH